MNIVAGAAFIIGSAILAGAVDVAMLVVGRVLLGIGVGLCSLVSHMAVWLICAQVCLLGIPFHISEQGRTVP